MFKGEDFKNKLTGLNSFQGELHIGTGIVLGSFVFRFKPWYNLWLFFYPPFNTELLDARGVVASLFKRSKISNFNLMLIFN